MCHCCVILEADTSFLRGPHGTICQVCLVVYTPVPTAWRILRVIMAHPDTPDPSVSYSYSYRSLQPSQHLLLSLVLAVNQCASRCLVLFRLFLHMLTSTMVFRGMSRWMSQKLPPVNVWFRHRSGQVRRFLLRSPGVFWNMPTTLPGIGQK